MVKARKLGNEILALNLLTGNWNMVVDRLLEICLSPDAVNCVISCRDGLHNDGSRISHVTFSGFTQS